MTKRNLTKPTALLLAGVLVTSCFVGGTFARYITTTSSEDSARVAVWGINADGVDMELFASEYDVNGNKVAKSWDGAKIIAPGTSMASKFSIVNLDDTLAPEVMYEVRIDVDDTEIDQRILDNPSIQWKLDDNSWGTWESTKADILALSGDASGVKTYAPNTVATEFANGKEHTIAWQWMLDDNNVQDTAMGNEAVDEDIMAKIHVKVTARQVQEDTTGLLSGEGQTFNSILPTALTFRSAAPVDELVEVKVDDDVLTEDTDYTVTSGSTIITLKEDYLKSLAVGSYKLSIVSENGTVATTFTVSEGLAKDESGNYLVATAQDLFVLAELVNSGEKDFFNETILLTNNIDLKNVAFTPIGVYDEEHKWWKGNMFRGTFDGQENIIYNLNVTSPDPTTTVGASAGLFGYINGGIIKDLTVDGATVNSTHYAGVIVGNMKNKSNVSTDVRVAVVDNCHVLNATVTSTYHDADNSGDKAGVVVGNVNTESNVKNCSATDSTVIASRDAGQVVGCSYAADVTNCTATNVTVSWNNLGTGANIRNEIIGRVR